MATESLSPECRLVYRSADMARSDGDVEALVAEVRDWERALWLAEREAATSALHKLLLRAAPGAAPSEVMAYLARSAKVSDFRMRHLSERLQRTTRVFAERGIPCLLLKGAAVGAMTDPTFCSRPMTDTDLLIHRTDAARARQAVIDSGWAETTDPILLELLRDHHHLPYFLDPQLPGIRLELHIALLPDDHSFAFHEADIWHEAVPAPDPFGGTLVPSRELMVLHAAIHFAWQHTLVFGAWRTFRSITAMMDSATFDSERLVRLARDAKAATVCYWTLRLSQRLTGRRVPDGMLSRLAAPTARSLCDAIERHFISTIVPAEGPPSPSIKLSRLLWRMALRPKWSGHRVPGRWDPEDRWGHARGTASTERLPARLVRHATGYRAWWNFVSRTLLP